MKRFKLVTSMPRARALRKGAIRYPQTKGSVVVVPHHNNLNIGSGDFSISLWARTTDDSIKDVNNTYFPTFIAKDNLPDTREGYQFFWFYYYTAGVYYGPYVTFTVWDGGSSTVCQYQYTTDIFETGNWQHLVATKDSQNLKLYINKDLKVTQSHSLGNIVNNKQLSIGGYYDGGPWADFGGDLDKIRIFKGYALTQDDVNQIYYTKHTSKTMVAYYDFQDDLKDGTGNGHSGTAIDGWAPSATISFTDGVGGRIDETLSFQLENDELKFKISDDILAFQETSKNLKFKENSTILSFKLNDYDQDTLVFQTVLEFFWESGGIY